MPLYRFRPSSDFELVFSRPKFEKWAHKHPELWFAQTEFAFLHRSRRSTS